MSNFLYILGGGILIIIGLNGGGSLPPEGDLIIGGALIGIGLQRAAE